MKSIALVVLYFGKIPDYAKLFFYSLQYNSSIDVLLFTDQELESGSNNLIIYHTTFDKIKKRIQDKFDFNIVLEDEYKKVSSGFDMSEQEKEEKSIKSDMGEVINTNIFWDE